MQQMSGRVSRRRLFVLTVVVTSVLSGSFVLGPSAADAGRRLGIDDFMTGLACTESGGRFDALNSKSGSYGKYQFMPRIWMAWSARYLGDRWADPTPRNQEFVARSRIADLYEKHGSWRRVAHWWLTGNAHPDESKWSKHTTKYVDRVMETARDATVNSLRSLVPERCFPANVRPPRIRTEPWPRVVVRGGRVYLRHGPGSESRAFEVVRRGQRLAVLGRDNDARGKEWLHIGLMDGREGWIAAWYTRPLEAR